jgi:kinesin family member 12
VTIPKHEPKKKELPPLNKGTKEASGKPLSVSKMQEKEKTTSVRAIEKTEIEVSLNKIVQEYEFEMTRLEHENQELRNAREVAEKNYMIVNNDNNALQIKLENLEELFIKNSTTKKNINQEYINCNLVA